MIVRRPAIASLTRAHWPKVRQFASARCYSIRLHETGVTEAPQTARIQPRTFYLDKYLEHFGKDTDVSSLVYMYKSLQLHPQQELKVGVLYGSDELRKSSRIIESILSDPLAKDNKVWFDKVSQRSRQHNNVFDYNEEVDVIEGRFLIPSPVLNQYTRPTFMNPESVVTLNGMSLVEINDARSANWKELHFAILVVEDITSTWKLANEVANKVLFTVIDNKDFTPHSTEAVAVAVGGKNHMIKIDSDLLYGGIQDFLINDTKASNHYLQSLVESNIFQLLKTIGHNMQIEQLAQWYLANIISKLSSDENTQKDLDKLYEVIKFDQIKKFSIEIHSELQDEFIPNTTKFFNKRLRWWRLYFINDNVEYDLKDYFGKHFMPRSIENYNYSRGKIVSQLQREKFADYSTTEFHNPLARMKSTLIGERISTEIQPVVTSSLLLGFVYYQLPISIVAVASYGFFDFSANSAVALFSLGMVMGFNHVSKAWEKFTRQWLHDLFEQVRVCLDRECTENGLLQELTVRYKEEQKFLETKKVIVDGLKE